MAAGDIIQSKGISSGNSTANSVIVMLPAAVSSGNTVLVALSAQGEPTSVPAGFTLVDDPGGNVVYTGQPAGQSSWTFGFADIGPVAGFVSEHQGAAVFSSAAYTSAASQNTSSAGPSIASSASDMLLDYCFAGSQPTSGGVTAWTNGYSLVGQASSDVDGAFNFNVAMAIKRSTGAASSTTATLDAASWWTHFQVAGTFSGGTSGGGSSQHVLFRIDAGGTLVPIDVTAL